MFRQTWIAIAAGLVLTPGMGFRRPASNLPSKPNVLFIAVDDLNHWVGHLGRNAQTLTPNIDRLAAMGVSFTNAHCAAPLCNPSRAALMSGLRPGSTGIYGNRHDWQSVIDTKHTLTTRFLKAGYRVYGAGKIYFASVYRPKEWTDSFMGEVGKVTPHPSASDNGVGMIRFKPLTNDSTLADESIVDYAIEQLKAKQKKPFFLAVGLVKPHLPWDVPKKYYDLFPLDSIELPPIEEDDLNDVPGTGVAMATAKGEHEAMLESDRWREAVQAYLAAVAYCDAQVGRLLDAYESSPHRNDTLIVLWSDNGMHLGEKEHWRKFALWEEATRVPYIWVVPGLTEEGELCSRPVDLMSIYPTLCSLCGLKTPQHVEGVDITPLLLDPHASWDFPALTRFHRNNHAVRTEKWRYIRYADGGEELYDHESDPFEWVNLAGDSEYTELKAYLAAWLPSKNKPELDNSNKYK